MANDGRLELVVTLDYTGRAFYTTLVVFSEQNGRIVTAKVTTNGANLTDLKTRIVDLKSEGTQELAIPRLLHQYAGADPVATFTDVYVFSGGALTESDSMFRNYYLKTRLPYLSMQLNTLNRGSQGPLPGDLKKASALQEEIDLINSKFAR